MKDPVRPRDSDRLTSPVRLTDQCRPVPATSEIDCSNASDAGARGAGNRLRIAAPMLSRLANFDDADPLRLEPGVDFRWVPPGQPVPRDADVVILFGTKSTLGDLAFMRDQGWDHDVLAHARGGGRVLGLCGGLSDARHPHCRPGRGRRPARTGARPRPARRMHRDDRSEDRSSRSGTLPHHRVARDGVRDSRGSYDRRRLCKRPLFDLDRRADGARSIDGLIEGSYVHGVFSNDDFRRAWLRRAGGSGSNLDYTAAVEQTIDRVADGVGRGCSTSKPCWIAQLRHRVWPNAAP